MFQGQFKCWLADEPEKIDVIRTGSKAEEGLIFRAAEKYCELRNRELASLDKITVYVQPLKAESQVFKISIFKDITINYLAHTGEEIRGAISNVTT